MVILGLLLVVAALAGGAFLFVGTSSLSATVGLTVLSVTVSLPPLALVIAGAAVVLALWLGWAILRSGAKRSARLRRESKEAARVAKSDQATKEREWAAERERADRERTDAEQAARQRLEDQRLATETARQRAEAAERRVDDGDGTR